MQIQLKQAEIIEALKQYISKQGISLSGKDVSITFTAGRKESGISADLIIDDMDIPGFSDPEVEEEPKAEQVKLSAVAPITQDEPVEDPKPELDTAGASKATSLFS